LSHAAASVQVFILNLLMSLRLVYLTQAHFRNPLAPNRHLQKRFHLSITTSSSFVGHKSLSGLAVFTIRSSAASFVLFRLSKTTEAAVIPMNGLTLYEVLGVRLGCQDSFKLLNF